MQTESIAAATGMGAVELAVTDGDRALRFYRDYVGLTPQPSPDSAIRLGAGGRELVVLYPDAERPVVPRTSGLYHLAILVPDRLTFRREYCVTARAKMPNPTGMRRSSIRASLMGRYSAPAVGTQRCGRHLGFY